MNKRKRILVVAVIVLLITGVSYFQYFEPVKVKISEIECLSWDATYEGVKGMEERIKQGNYDKNTEIINSYNGKLPSEDPNDYMNIYCRIKAKNRSFFDDFTVDGIVSQIDKYSENVLFTFTAGTAEKTAVYKLSDAEITVMLDVYIGNLNDDQVKELVNNLKITVASSGNYIKNREKEISLKGTKKITVEHEVS